MSAICWLSLAIQTLCFIGSTMLQVRMPKPEGMRYFAKQTRRYYYAARIAYGVQVASIVLWIFVMMHFTGGHR
jgi:hypothetical protein